ncbi:MAG TPA: response regulator [Verrucomicrobiae bacterium]
MRILIADDDRTSRVLLARILRNEPDCSVVEAMNGEDAWACLNEAKLPDLCIFDIRMPAMSGLELLQKMRADKHLQAIPVILCTAVSDRNVIVQAAALAVKYYIVKPYTEALVLTQVRNVKETLLQAQIQSEKSKPVAPSVEAVPAAEAAPAVVEQ